MEYVWKTTPSSRTNALIPGRWRVQAATSVPDAAAIRATGASSGGGADGTSEWR